MKFFKRKEEDNLFSVNDEFGEWLLIRRNPNVSLIKLLIEKTMKKLKIKNWDFSLLYYFEDEKIKGLLSIKGMINFQDYITEFDFYNALRSSISNYFALGEMRLSRLRACNFTFLFFSTDLFLKKAQRVEEERVKLLLPPKGVYGYEIPYTMKDLFIKLVERSLNTSCSSATISLSNGNLESIYQCRMNKNVEIDALKESFSYFSSEEPNISLKTISTGNLEIQINISKFRTKYLIPLLWGNIVASNIVC